MQQASTEQDVGTIISTCQAVGALWQAPSPGGCQDCAESGCVHAGACCDEAEECVSNSRRTQLLSARTDALLFGQEPKSHDACSIIRNRQRSLHVLPLMYITCTTGVRNQVHR